MLIERFGGSHGVLDMGLLESALARPRSGYYISLAEQAGALLHSLVNNHCFVDGNKRIAFALAAVFLRMNGYALKVGAGAAERFIINDVIENRGDAKKIAAWLSRRMKKA